MKARKFEIRIVWWEDTKEYSATMKGHPDLYQFSSAITNAIFADLTKKGVTDSVIETVIFCERCKVAMRDGDSLNLETDTALCEGCV